MATPELTARAAESRLSASTRDSSMSKPRSVSASARLPTIARKKGSEMCWRETLSYGITTAIVRFVLSRKFCALTLIE